jgi:hypothetical protein
MTPERIDNIVEHLYRLIEFRQWVQSNVLFPSVPDSIVHPLRERLLEAERALVLVLYEQGQSERVAALQKGLLKVPAL